MTNQGQIDLSALRWWTPLTVLVAAPIAGILCGAMTNWINIRVSPEYFEVVMGWGAPRPTLSQWAILQGMIEGGALGTSAGIALAVTVAASARFRCPMLQALTTLLIALGLAMSCWLLGGAVGAALGTTVPSLWGIFFVPVPSGVNIARFAWVGGTIWGAYAGTLLAIIVATVGFHLRWKRRLSRMQVSAFPVVQRRA